MNPRTPSEQWLDLAIELTGLPHAVERLSREHVDAGEGRCRACTQPGTGLPDAVWPCTLRLLADLADDLRSAARTIR